MVAFIAIAIAIVVVIVVVAAIVAAVVAAVELERLPDGIEMAGCST